MSVDATKTPEPVLRTFGTIPRFKDWKKLWDATKTEEEAIGLLHCLPKSFLAHDNAVALRFLLGLLCRTNELVGEKVYTQALRIFFFQVLKPKDRHEWIPFVDALIEHNELFPLTLTILEEWGRKKEYTDIRVNFIALCLKRDLKCPRDNVALLVRAYSKRVLKLSDNVNVADDPVEEIYRALRELSFEPYDGQAAPRDLDEACLLKFKGSTYARELLVIEAVKRAQGRCAREVADQEPTKRQAE